MQLSNAKIQNTIKILEASEIDETNQNSRISSNLELLQVIFFIKYFFFFTNYIN